MSHYSEVGIDFTDPKCLVAALIRVGFHPDHIEVHQEAKHLYGYQGDRREQKAHIIIRRQHVQSYANDIGFERLANGKIAAYISDFDRGSDGTGKYGTAWLGKLKQAYGIEKAKVEARKKGYRVIETRKEDGVRLTLRR